MTQSDVFSLLSASGPYPEYAEKLMLYGQFVGSWGVQATWYEPDGKLRKGRGEWHFAWVLGGRGVQDVLFAVGASPDKFGTTLRCYDPATGTWQIAWMQPYGGEFVHLVGRQVGERILQEGRGSDPARLERWSFSEITPDSFLWLGEVSLDEGATWTLEQEMRAKRYRSISSPVMKEDGITKRVKHAFGNFAPPGSKYLILGSFTGKQAEKNNPKWDPSYDWFYGTKGNQFWPILEAIYGEKLKDKETKQDFCKKYGIAIADLIAQCERRNGSNSDSNLTNKVYNQAIPEIITENSIAKIFFTSQYVEKEFRKVFKDFIRLNLTVELITLPSPSRRNTLNKEQKIAIYKELLPK